MTGNTALDITIIVLRAVVALMLILGPVPILIYFERKVAALIQDRTGPNRAHIGPFRLAGMVFFLADAVKLLFKEDFTPGKVNRFYFYLAPFIIVTIGFSTMAIVPWADTLVLGESAIPMQALSLNAGLLWFFALASLTVYGVVLAGWASNTKYSLLGAIRSTAQMISYEIPMGLSVIGILMTFGTLQLNEMVVQQGRMLEVLGVTLPIPAWGIFLQPLGFIIFLVAAFAETNRNPFDMVEDEGSLVGGFHTEYGSMKFALIFLGEYAAILVSSAIITTLFLGGWQVPYLPTEALVAHAPLLIQITLGLGAVLLTLTTLRLLKWYRDMQGQFGDIRDQEGLWLAVITGGLAVLCAAGLGLFMAVPLPAWGGSVFALLAQFGIFMAKVMFIAFVFIWVRWTLPRFRYDQVMDLGWKTLLPLALANILLTGIGLVLVQRL